MFVEPGPPTGSEYGLRQNAARDTKLPSPYHVYHSEPLVCH